MNIPVGSDGELLVPIPPPPPAAPFFLRSGCYFAVVGVVLLLVGGRIAYQQWLRPAQRYALQIDATETQTTCEAWTLHIDGSALKDDRLLLEIDTPIASQDKTVLLQKDAHHLLNIPLVLPVRSDVTLRLVDDGRKLRSAPYSFTTIAGQCGFSIKLVAQ